MPAAIRTGLLQRPRHVWRRYETEAFDALFEIADRSRISYGSDDLPVGVTLEKCVAFGRSWVAMSTDNQSFNVDHCDGRMTFTRYEMLRGMKQATSTTCFRATRSVWLRIRAAIWMPPYGCP